MTKLCNIEGDELVIRVPIETLNHVWLYVPHNDNRHRVTDVRLFAEAVKEQLNQESETGNTLLTLALDTAMELAIENGCEGVEEVG